MTANYTENKSYNKHLFNIIHSCSIEQLDAEIFAIAIDTEIDSFDMANDLINRAENLKARF